MLFVSFIIYLKTTWYFAFDNELKPTFIESRIYRYMIDSIEMSVSIKHRIRNYVSTSLCSCLPIVIIIIIEEVICIIAICKCLLLLLLRLVHLLWFKRLFIFYIILWVQIIIYIGSTRLLYHTSIGHSCCIIGLISNVHILLIWQIFLWFVHSCILWDLFSLRRSLHLRLDRISFILTGE